MAKQSPGGGKALPRRGARTGAAPSEGRARLVVLAGGSVGKKYLINQRAVIGRAREADIQVDDGEVSRRHVRIAVTGTGAFELEDLGSRNGTFVNELAVERVLLEAGDKIRLGDRLLLLFTRHDLVADEIMHRRRLEALGRLSAGIAHDFNNMLGAVIASLDYASSFPNSLVGATDIAESLQDALTAARRAAELTPRLLDFARSEQAHDMVDVSRLCAEVSRLAARTFDRAIVIRTDVAPGLSVLGSASQLHQALMNLCLNARDAMPDGGQLEISAGRLQAKRSPLSMSTVAITVRDTGAGMDEQTRARIFEAFFTTKSRGAGFGLGLASVAETVAEHGGELDVRSKLGEGSAFHLYLPRAVSSQPAIDTAQPPPSSGGKEGALHILVADDEQVVRRSVRRMLKLCGYGVIEARDGREAVELYRAAVRKPDLVLLDLDMPRLSGEEAQRELRRIDPSVCVLGISGHGDAAREREFRADGAVGFLRKPWQPSDLASLIANALHAGVRRRLSSDETTQVRALDEPGERGEPAD